MEDTRLGAILLESRIIREEDLERCLEIQLLAGGTRPLGQILVQERFVDSATLDHLLQVQETRRSRNLGQIGADGENTGKYLQAAVRVGAHELHLSEGRMPMARVAGDLRVLDDERLAGPEVWQFVRDHMGTHMLEVIADRHAVTQQFHIADLARGRMSAFRHSDGIGVNVRLHPAEVRAYDGQAFGEPLRETLAAGKGLVLLTGESGNGITETFATMLHEVARQGDRHVLVLDDCLEYPEPPAARVCMRRVGQHTTGYCAGLEAALRTEPDAIFLGDASQPEAFHLALNAAESGRLVVAAVHANSTTAVLKRVINFYPHYAQGRVRSILASVLKSIVAVRLVAENSRQRYRLATEVLRFGESVREIVRAGSIEKIKLLLRLEGGEHGHSMDDSLLRLLRDRTAAFDSVFPFAQDKHLFLRAIDFEEVASRG